MFVLATIDIEKSRTLMSLKFVILILNERNDIEISLCTIA